MAQVDDDLAIIRIAIELGLISAQQGDEAMALRMSPEQWGGIPERIQAPADQYSVGCMLYEVVTGDPPFGDTTTMAVLAGKAEREDPPRPRN